MKICYYNLNYPNLRPLVKFKFDNFKPVYYESKKAKTLASLSAGSNLPFCSGAFKPKVAIETLQEHEAPSEILKKYPDEIPVFQAETIEEYQKQIRALLQSGNSIINTKELVYNYMKKYNDLVNI